MNIHNASTILSVRDLEASLHFYVDILGFQKDFEAEGDYHGMYAGVSYGPASLHLSAFPDAQDHCPGAVYMMCDDVDGVATELRQRGARLDSPPTDQPYGMREFHLHDPDQNILGFGEPVHHPESAS